MASTTFPFQSRKNLNSVSPINAIFTNDISLAHLLVTDIPSSLFIPFVALFSIAFFSALHLCINPSSFATARTTTRKLTNQAKNFCIFDFSFTCKNGINPTIFSISSERISFTTCNATCDPIECPTRKHLVFVFSSSITLDFTYRNTCAFCSSNVYHRGVLLAIFASAWCPRNPTHSTTTRVVVVLRFLFDNTPPTFRSVCRRLCSKTNASLNARTKLE
mmetsp:Transcript_6321/g.18744  ORF Transcript_6321/g.18744 Transcript_6321/m.18744 type:complete len:219 (+) Transcript_6321:1651-2307(+)